MRQCGSSSRSSRYTLVPPIVVRDELESGILVEHCRIAQVTERFYAIIRKRRFPDRLLGELLATATDRRPKPAAPSSPARS